MDETLPDFSPAFIFNRRRIRWCLWTLVWRWFGIRSFPRNSEPIHVKPGQKQCYIRRSHGHKGVDWRRTWRFRVGRFPRASLFITFPRSIWASRSSTSFPLHVFVFGQRLISLSPIGSNFSLRAPLQLARSSFSSHADISACTLVFQLTTSNVCLNSSFLALNSNC